MRERLDASGNIILPLELDDLRPIIARCKEEKIEAIAILFLHSYANPEHEILCAGILADALPEVTVCASHAVSRQWREYERTNTAVLNAYVQPIIQYYFERLEDALMKRGLTCPYYAMQSNGGISTFDQAVGSPLTLVGSGPAGGVAGAARIGEALGESEVLSLDVGGTTAKCSLIHGGRPTLNVDYKLEHTRIRPGHPVQVPVVDIVEIGSGGGSIARLDDRGALRVGPESAGSTPGPACYGHGGKKPTLSDAILTVGIFDPATFAGGSMHLDKQKAADAIATVATPLGMSIEDAAIAIIDIAHASMINALEAGDGPARPRSTRCGFCRQRRCRTGAGHPPRPGLERQGDRHTAASRHFLRLGHAGGRTARRFSQHLVLCPDSGGAGRFIAPVRRPRSRGRGLFRQGPRSGYPLHLSG